MWGIKTMSARDWRLSLAIVLLVITPAICAGRPAPITISNSTSSSKVDYLCSSKYEWIRQQKGIIFSFGTFCLPTVPDSPDPLGISLVSGFYGPGSWTSWVLTLMASYVRLYLEPYAKLDPNTWLFLLGTNWAAVDLLRQIRTSSQSGDGNAKPEKRAGAIAASLTIVYWGCIYVSIQLLVILLIQTRKVRPLTQRFVTLLSGSLLPTISLAVALCSTTINGSAAFIGGVATDNLPFLYFWGSPSVSLYIYNALSHGFLMFILVVIALNSMFFRFCLWGRFKWARTWSDTWEIRTVKPFTLLVILLAGVPQMILFGGMVANAFVYVPMGFRTTWSQSCFYMPCAPQSLLDWDQLYSLVVGLVLLFGVEIAPAILKTRKEKRNFEKSLRKRIDKGLNRRRARASALDGADPAAFTNIGMDGDDIELGSLHPDKDDEEPDATLDFDTLDRAILYETFAASENDSPSLAFVNKADDGIGSAVGEDEAFGGKLYLMSGALMVANFT